MNGSFEQFSQEDLRAAAEKLEKVARKANAALLKVGYLEQEKLIPAVVDVYSEILRFDSFTKKKFEKSIEEKRVRSLGQGSVIMTCVMAAAVALTEFKNAPKPLQQNFLQKGLMKFKSVSSHPLSLAGLSLAGFYGLLGRGIFKRAKDAASAKAIGKGFSGLDFLKKINKK